MEHPDIAVYTEKQRIIYKGREREPAGFRREAGWGGAKRKRRKKKKKDKTTRGIKVGKENQSDPPRGYI